MNHEHFIQFGLMNWIIPVMCVGSKQNKNKDSSQQDLKMWRTEMRRLPHAFFVFYIYNISFYFLLFVLLFFLLFVLFFPHSSAFLQTNKHYQMIDD